MASWENDMSVCLVFANNMHHGLYSIPQPTRTTVFVGSGYENLQELIGALQLKQWFRILFGCFMEYLQLPKPLFW